MLIPRNIVDKFWSEAHFSASISLLTIRNAVVDFESKQAAVLDYVTEAEALVFPNRPVGYPTPSGLAEKMLRKLKK